MVVLKGFRVTYNREEYVIRKPQLVIVVITVAVWVNWNIWIIASKEIANLMVRNKPPRLTHSALCIKI